MRGRARMLPLMKVAQKFRRIVPNRNAERRCAEREASLYMPNHHGYGEISTAPSGWQ